MSRDPNLDFVRSMEKIMFWGFIIFIISLPFILAKIVGYFFIFIGWIFRCIVAIFGFIGGANNHPKKHSELPGPKLAVKVTPPQEVYDSNVAPVFRGLDLKKKIEDKPVDVIYDDHLKTAQEKDEEEALNVIYDSYQGQDEIEATEIAGNGKLLNPKGEEPNNLAPVFKNMNSPVILKKSLFELKKPSFEYKIGKLNDEVVLYLKIIGAMVILAVLYIEYSYLFKVLSEFHL